MKKRLTKTAKWRIAAICLLFLLWGIGGFAQPVTNMQATNYTANEVAFTITWDELNYNDSLWVIIDYVKVDGATTVGNWSRATVTYGTVTGDVSGNTVAGGQGFWIFPDKTAGSASVTAWLTLAGGVEQFNWCAYALNVPPRAVLLTDGSYQLHGTKPFTVNGTTLGNTVSSFAGACMISFTDFTGNPAGIFTAAPTVSTSNPDPRCDAGAVTLTATASGTTTANTYTWTVGGAAETTTSSATYAPTVNAAGTTYSVTVTNAAGCTSAAATGTITVNALPTSLSLSSATICYGQSTTLTASVTNAASYSIDNTNWQTATTFSVNNPTATTNYTLYVKSTAGCTATKANAATVTVNALPTISDVTSPTICKGTAATLTANVAGGAADPMTYTWNVGEATYNSYDGSYTLTSVPASASYTVRVQNANGCESLDASGSITLRLPGEIGAAADQICGCEDCAVNCEGMCRENATTTKLGVCSPFCKQRCVQTYDVCGNLTDACASTTTDTTCASMTSDSSCATLKGSYSQNETTCKSGCCDDGSSRWHWNGTWCYCCK